MIKEEFFFNLCGIFPGLRRAHGLFLCEVIITLMVNIYQTSIQYLAVCLAHRGAKLNIYERMIICQTLYTELLQHTEVNVVS